MSILLVSEVFPPKVGGSGRWFWEIYRRLPRREVVIAAGEDPGQGQFDQTHDLRVVRVPLTLRQWGLRSLEGLHGYARALPRLRRLVKAERVRALHCGKCLPEGLMALALKLWYGLPYLCYCHGEEVNCASTSRELSWLIRRVLAGAERLIVNSQNTLRLLREEWDVAPQRLTLLHPGVDTAWFVPAPRDPKVRAELGWGDRPVVLTVGRLQKRKGQDQMIRAFPQILRTIPAALYVIVGDGEERAALQQLVHQQHLNSRVRFQGEVDDEGLRRCYQQCDLFVLPNRQVGKDIEGFGMVLLEAQACGRPVLAGASGGTSETMDAPHTGQVVSCDSPEPLAGAVAQLLADPDRRAGMAVRARQWVMEHFDWDQLSKQAARLFAKELRAKPTPAQVEASI
jgi:phosphatidylinositol alpha-1,6-mannosyltransferase